MKLEYEVFAVDEEFHSLWDVDIHETNDEFLRNFNVDYFDQIGDLLAPSLDDESTAHAAALAIRTFFSQAVETLFALMFAAVQAPHVPLGWLLKYYPRDLSKVVRKFQDGVAFPTVFNIEIGSWQQLAYIFNPFQTENAAEGEALKQGFSDFWSWLASEFVEESYKNEYNSLKHGLRVRQGGYAAIYGGHVLSSSSFGSSFFVSKSLARTKSHFWAERCSRNWDPRGMCTALSSISASINNIVSSLRLLRGEANENLSFHGPIKAEDFKASWANPKCLGTIQFNRAPIEERHLPDLSEQRLRELYDKRRIDFLALSASEVHLAPNQVGRTDA